MNILGFQFAPNCHDTSAAMVCDGVLVAAAEEERFTRRKHESALPVRSIEFCLRAAGLSMEQVDLIAFPEKPFRSGPDSYLACMDWDLLRDLRAVGKTTFTSVIHKRLLEAFGKAGLQFNLQMNRQVAEGFAQLQKVYSKLPAVRFYDHHKAHAAAAYLTAGTDTAAIATIDFAGGPYSSVTWKGEAGTITRLRAQGWHNSLGEFYWDATRYLGLGDFADGKTMGLAPYGNSERFENLFAAILDRHFRWYGYDGWSTLDNLRFPAREKGQSPLADPYPSLAAAVQSTLESAQQRIVHSAAEDAKTRVLCLGGGVALNCSANGALLDSGFPDSVWVFPASGDAGLAVGAALLCAAESGEFRRARLETAYLGPEFDARECEIAVAKEPRVALARTRLPLVEEVAAALEAGLIVGVCRGRMEFGPRALGNRSIFADARLSEHRDRVNRLKRREHWRPLAPTVLAERASEFFDLSQPSPFMLFRANVRHEKRSIIPAVVHVDGSARPQTVTRKQNAFCYDLISSFCRRTGVPVVLNTSFNGAGEPIVCTPQDAVKTFLAAELDLLVLGDFLVARRQSSPDLPNCRALNHSVQST